MFMYSITVTLHDVAYFNKDSNLLPLCKLHLHPTGPTARIAAKGS